MRKLCWLVKQEPETYSWTAFAREGGTAWTGIRNFQARNHLRSMKVGDRVLFYHSVSEKRIVGIARVAREFYPDPGAKEGDWSAVDLRPCKSLNLPVSLEAIKADPILREMPMVRHTRLSVSPVTETQFERIMELAQTRP